VQSSINYTLPLYVEKLVLTGTAPLAGTGNSLKNTLTGNDGDNVLDGKGGNDTMAGGKGNDTYIVANAGDVVNESPGQGTDTIKSSISYVLPANVEKLELTGAGATSGTGNGLWNRLIGNGADNTLSGMGGSDFLDGKGGADDLVGGPGNDTFIYDPLDVSVDGGEGLRDQLRVSGSGVSINLDTLAGTVLSGIEVIDLRGSGNNSLSMSAASIEALLGTAAGDFVVQGNAGDTATSTDVWTLDGNPFHSGGREYQAYTSALTDVRLFVETGVELIMPT
jgi:hypothetical protein